MIVLDTTVISEALRPTPDPGVVAWLEALTGDVGITTITLAEVLTGVRRMPNGRRKNMLTREVRAAVEPFRGSGNILAFDADAADRYADIVVMREKIGRPISMADAEIAAICRSQRATCATRNAKHFDDLGIALVNPWDYTSS